MTRPSRTSRFALLLADHRVITVAARSRCRALGQRISKAPAPGFGQEWPRQCLPGRSSSSSFTGPLRGALEPASLNTKSFGSRCPTSAVLRMSDLSGNVPMCRVSRLPRPVKHRPRRHRPHSETVVRVLRQAREEKELSETVKPPKLGTKPLGLLKP